MRIPYNLRESDSTIATGAFSKWDIVSVLLAGWLSVRVVRVVRVVRAWAVPLWMVHLRVRPVFFRNPGGGADPALAAPPRRPGRELIPRFHGKAGGQDSANVSQAGRRRLAGNESESGGLRPGSKPGPGSRSSWARSGTRSNLADSGRSKHGG